MWKHNFNFGHWIKLHYIQTIWIIKLNSNLKKANKYAIVTKNIVLKNLIAINISFFFVFSPLNNVLSIQSVLNKEDDLGTVGQLTLFITQFFTCLLIPQVMIEKFGFKKILTLGQIFFAVYTSANFYPRLYTIIPSIKEIDKVFFSSAALLCGFGNSLSWTIIAI